MITSQSFIKISKILLLLSVISFLFGCAGKKINFKNIFGQNKARTEIIEPEQSFVPRERENIIDESKSEIKPLPEEKKIETKEQPVEQQNSEPVKGTEIVVDTLNLDQEVNRPKNFTDSETFLEPLTVPEPDIKKVELEKTIELDRIYFDFDKSDIKPEYKTVLDAHVKWLQEHANYNVLIEGHTDNRGSSQYNLGLGQERASKARAYLSYFGINPARIATISYGEEKPLIDKNDQDSWAKNRRAEFRAYKNEEK